MKNRNNSFDNAIERNLPLIILGQKLKCPSMIDKLNNHGLAFKEILNREHNDTEIHNHKVKFQSMLSECVNQHGVRLYMDNLIAMGFKLEYCKLFEN